MNTPPYPEGDDVDPDVEDRDISGFEHVFAWLVVIFFISWFLVRMMS
jgi:hypothetical protein